MTKAAKTKTKKEDRVRIVVTIRHDYTAEEYKEKSGILTRKMKDRDLQEEQIKAVAATAKAKLKSLKSDISDLANELDNGFNMINVEAWVEFNRKKGEKRFYHNAPGKPHNNEFIRVEPMTEADFQSLPLDEDAVPAVAPAAPGEDQPLPNPVLPVETEQPTKDPDEF